MKRHGELRIYKQRGKWYTYARYLNKDEELISCEALWRPALMDYRFNTLEKREKSTRNSFQNWPSKLKQKIKISSNIQFLLALELRDLENNNFLKNIPSKSSALRRELSWKLETPVRWRNWTQTRGKNEAIWDTNPNS